MSKQTNTSLCAHETVVPYSCMAESIYRCDRDKADHEFLEVTGRIDHPFEER